MIVSKVRSLHIIKGNLVDEHNTKKVKNTYNLQLVQHFACTCTCSGVYPEKMITLYYTGSFLISSCNTGSRLLLTFKWLRTERCSQSVFIHYFKFDKHMCIVCFLLLNIQCEIRVTILICSYPQKLNSKGKWMRPELIITYSEFNMNGLFFLHFILFVWFSAGIPE